MSHLSNAAITDNLVEATALKNVQTIFITLLQLSATTNNYDKLFITAAAHHVSIDGLLPYAKLDHVWSYDFVVSALNHGMSPKLQFSVDGLSVTLPCILAHTGHLSVLLQLLDDGVITFAACAVTPEDMWEHLAVKKADVSLVCAIMDHFGSGLQGLCSVYLVQWIEAHRPLMPALTAELSRGLPRLARAVVEVTPINSQAVTIAAKHGFVDWLNAEAGRLATVRPEGYKSWKVLSDYLLSQGGVSKPAVEALKKLYHAPSPKQDLARPVARATSDADARASTDSASRIADLERLVQQLQQQQGEAEAAAASARQQQQAEVADLQRQLAAARDEADTALAKAADARADADCARAETAAACAEAAAARAEADRARSVAAQAKVADAEKSMAARKDAPVTTQQERKEPQAAPQPEHHEAPPPRQREQQHLIERSLASEAKAVVASGKARWVPPHQRKAAAPGPAAVVPDPAQELLVTRAAAGLKSGSVTAGTVLLSLQAVRWGAVSAGAREQLAKAALGRRATGVVALLVQEDVESVIRGMCALDASVRVILQKYNGDCRFVRVAAHHGFADLIAEHVARDAEGVVRHLCSIDAAEARELLEKSLDQSLLVRVAVHHGLTDLVPKFVHRRGAQPPAWDPPAAHRLADNDAMNAWLWLVRGDGDVDDRVWAAMEAIRLVRPTHCAGPVQALAAVHRSGGRVARQGAASVLGLLPQAAATDQLDAVKCLVEAGADVNVSDGRRQTPLHVATDARVAQYLIENKASVSAKNNSGETPLRCATRWGRSAVAAYLRSVNAPA
jgi:hypothetical protein